MGNLIRVLPKRKIMLRKVIRFFNVSNIIIKNENHCSKILSLNILDCIRAFKLFSVCLPTAKPGRFGYGYREKELSFQRDSQLQRHIQGKFTFLSTL